jgi:tetratricopeptide (TPR) repeat protein
LKGLGATYAAIKNYPEAEKYYTAAIEYAIPQGATTTNPLKLEGLTSFDIPNSGIIVVPNSHCVQGDEQRGYRYYIDAYLGMFIIHNGQNNTEKAFEWLEKAFQQSAKENGNDISETLMEEVIFRAYPNLNQARFKALKAKYFPLPDTKK